MRNLNRILKDLLKKSARKEAFDILSKATDAERLEFIGYYIKDSDNISCLVLDTIKRRLVAEKQMEQKEKDNFGWPLE